MIQGWLLLLVSLLYVGLLFVVAYAGDRRPLYLRQPRLWQRMEHRALQGVAKQRMVVGDEDVGHGVASINYVGAASAAMLFSTHEEHRG